jgi:hypothetical protein
MASKALTAKAEKLRLQLCGDNGIDPADEFGFVIRPGSHEGLSDRAVVIQCEGGNPEWVFVASEQYAQVGGFTGMFIEPVNHFTLGIYPA